jgi:hypothetical protein
MFPKDLFSRHRDSIEQTIVKYILPLPFSSGPSTSKAANDVDEVAWTDRLLLTMKYLSEPSLNSLLSISTLKHVCDHFFFALQELQLIIPTVVPLCIITSLIPV